MKHSLMAYLYPMLTVIAYLLIGMILPFGWAYGWILFLTIPIYYTAKLAIIKGSLLLFCFPMVPLIIFLVLGFAFSLWSVAWVLFLTIPVYYLWALYKKNNPEE